MNSKITIEIDLENNNEPYIKVKSALTDDLRDKILRSFLEQFGHQNGWLTFEYTGTDESSNNYYRIRAIAKKDLYEHASLMNAMVYPEKPKSPVQYPIVDTDFEMVKNK